MNLVTQSVKDSARKGVRLVILPVIGGRLANVVLEKMLTEKIKQFREAWEVALMLIVACLIFFAGQWYGSAGNITKLEIKRLVKTQVILAEDRLTAQIQRNRLRIDKIEPPIHADNIEKIYQIQE